VKGRVLALSRARRIVTDHSRFAQKMPMGVLTRTINVAPLMAARAVATPRPPLTALFVKAFALVAQDSPPFRQAYVKLPWPHIYEYPVSIASLVVERSFEGEDVIFLGRVKDPASRPVDEIAGLIAEAKAQPVESVRDFRRALAFARVPLLLRRALWWLGMNIGRQRPNFFGTFGVSVLGGDGVEVVHPVSPWTIFLSYGPISANGDVRVLLAFDHRVMDGAVVSRGFTALETALNGALVAEITQR
jgi:hypothetical protein